jgi:DNA-binding HxlR family transcriptional regulator
MNAVNSTQTRPTEPLVEMFSHLGRPCAVPLIFALGERAFNADVRELRNSIDVNGSRRVSESTISKCLSDLASLGLVEESVHAHSPLRAEYSLTDSGQQVYRHLLQMRHIAEYGTSRSNPMVESISAC